MCTVVNKYKKPYDVYIGRGSPWGNPFVIGKDGTREEVIEMYRFFLWKAIRSGGVTRAHLLDLDGKTLGCFCKPKPCHGDVIQEAVKWAVEQATQEDTHAAVMRRTADENNLQLLDLPIITPSPEDLTGMPRSKDSS